MSGPFEAFYGSALQHPFLLWGAALSAGAWCFTRRGLRGDMRGYCAALVVLSLLDAWLTAGHVFGIGRLPGVAASAVPLLFVLAGDFRYLLLIGCATAGGGLELRGRAVLAAAVLTAAVPVASQLGVGLLGSESPRVLFLLYECLFAALTLALLRWHPRVRAVPWLAGISRFVLLYYGLWASADAILLISGSDLGFAIRVVPNVLYYGGLIAAVGSAAARARG